MSADAVQEIKRTEATKNDMLLGQIEELDKSLTAYFPDTLVVDNALTRKLVSFQANKTRTYYRWYKYKEAFSADLVEYLFRKYKIAKGKMLDPFAGAGTALFVCSALGIILKALNSYRLGKKLYRQMCWLEARINKGLFLDWKAGCFKSRGTPKVKLRILKYFA